MCSNQPKKAKTQSDWIFTNLIFSSLGKVSAKKNVKVLPFSIARVTHQKVSGNHNAIESSVNITDFRLSFHRKKSRYQNETCVMWLETMIFK